MRSLSDPSSERPIAPVILPDGRTVPVLVRHSGRARRLALRLDRSQQTVELVLPPGVTVGQAARFLESKRGWVIAQSSRLPQRTLLTEGASIPLLGIPHRIAAAAPGRGGAGFSIGPGVIEIGGRPEHLARRARAGLSRHALGLLRSKTGAAAARIGRTCPRVSVGDARSRWGSCAASGNIRYSWRLVFAPEAVMDYVVAHEVAHLLEMNHAPRFWAVVETLCPGHGVPRDWLKRHGAELLAIG
jgi:predicted metal-dependent hydrolase